MTVSDTSQASQSRTFAVSVTPAIASTALDLHQALGQHQERHSAVDLWTEHRSIFLDRFPKLKEEWPAPQFK